MIIGIDIGGTNTDGVAIDDDGSILHRIRYATALAPEGVTDTAARVVEQLAAMSSLAVSEVGSIGVGVPGPVDADHSRVTHAVNLGIEDFDLGAALAERLGRRVYIENDVNAAAVGAFELMGMPSTQSLAFLNLGTGLAAGIVLEGRLWRGSRGAAGEMGHLAMGADGRRCPCGQSGCLENSASGSAIARQWPASGPSLLDARTAGDPVAERIWDQLCESAAAAIRILVLTFDVDLVVVSGGLTSIGAPLSEGIHDRLFKRAWASPFIASLRIGERVMMLPPSTPAAVLGAARMGKL